MLYLQLHVGLTQVLFTAIDGFAERVGKAAAVGCWCCWCPGGQTWLLSAHVQPLPAMAHREELNSGHMFRGGIQLWLFR